MNPWRITGAWLASRSLLMTLGVDSTDRTIGTIGDSQPTSASGPGARSTQQGRRKQEPRMKSGKNGARDGLPQPRIPCGALTAETLPGLKTRLRLTALAPIWTRQRHAAPLRPVCYSPRLGCHFFTACCPRSASRHRFSRRASSISASIATSAPPGRRES